MNFNISPINECMKIYQFSSNLVFNLNTIVSAKASLTASRSAANAIYVIPLLQVSEIVNILITCIPCMTYTMYTPYTVASYLLNKLAVDNTTSARIQNAQNSLYTKSNPHPYSHPYSSLSPLSYCRLSWMR